MKILMIGGTRFVGAHLVDAALSAGHQVTIYNRGQSNPAWFPEIEKRVGDRNQDLSALETGNWDAVIDTCAYFPRQVNLLLTTLKGRFDYYILISSISVYAETNLPGIDETARLAVIDDESIEEITNGSYGGLKVLCEQAAIRALPDSALIIRPGLIVGPRDPTDRFAYWPARISRGGEVLVPDSPDWRTQFIDGRDLASWTVHMIEQATIGIFNATGPAEPVTFGKLIHLCSSVAASEPRFTWVAKDFLLANQIQPWGDLPLWLPGDEFAGMNQVNIARALNQGLIFRSLEETIRDTLEWLNTRPRNYSWRCGLTQERETQLLTAWHIRRDLGLAN